MFLFQKTKSLEQNDEQLLNLFRLHGDRQAITELFRRYANKTLYACAFYFEDKEKAKDAVMQIFQKILEGASGSEIMNFKGWLSFVIRNHCITELRKEKSAAKRHSDFYEFEYETPDEEELFNDSEETVKVIRQVLKNCVLDEIDIDALPVFDLE